MRMMLVVGQLLLMVASSSSSQSVSSNCQETCGNVSVPYPFGIGDGCFSNKYFSIDCSVPDTTTTPKPYLWASNAEVIDISLDGELRISTYIGEDCYTESGVQQRPPLTAFTILPAFPFSNTKNKFTAIGCDTLAVITGSNGKGFSSGCLSVCARIEDVTDGVCDGIGCCQTSIPEMLLDYNASVTGMNNHRKVPSVLDWAVWNETCDEAAKDPASFGCKAHSECFDSTNMPGYRCNCSSGYEGNPYLGCVDIN